MLKKDIKEIMDLWNNHSIRRQKLGDTIPGIPEILYQNPEIVGNNDFIFLWPKLVHWTSLEG